MARDVDENQTPAVRPTVSVKENNYRNERSGLSVHVSRTALDLTPQERMVYSPLRAIEQRRRSGNIQVEERWQNAQGIAREAAKILYEEFRATKVVLFGSVTDRSRFTLWSDVDLATWGIAPERFYAAVAAVTGVSDEITVDLVDAEECSTALRKTIQQEGVKL
jgi:predicted nucleotidyltransferase